MFFDNFVTFSLAIGLLFIIIYGNSFDTKINKYFILGIFNVVLLAVVDMIDYHLSGFTTLNNFRYVSSALGYTLRPAVLVIIISILLRKKKIGFILWAPIVLLALIAFTTPFTHAMFWFDEDNVFHRGVLGLTSHILSAIYMLTMVVLTIKTYSDTDYGETFTILYIIMILCCGATVIESTIKIKFLLPGSIMVSLCIYYMYLYTQTYKRDTLTGALNRRTFYLDAKKNSAKPMTIISMDLNGLKQLNDNEGHASGDLALTTLVEIAKKITGKKYHVYRTGGDEFMIIGIHISEEETIRCIDTIRSELSKTKYMAAFGYAMYKSEDIFEERVHSADMEMYKDKQNYQHR